MAIGLNLVKDSYTNPNVPVWSLRILKIHALATAALPKGERERGLQNADVAERHDSAEQRPKLSLAFAVKACFSMTKV